MFTVIISEKGGQQTKYDFNKTEITIGRTKGNDIVLPKGNVSKQHTRIFKRDNGYYIVDMGSTNGTYVNGRKVANEQSLSGIDKIYIGDFILQLEARSDAMAGPAKLPPQPPRGPSMQPPIEPPQNPQFNPRNTGARDTIQQAAVSSFTPAQPVNRGFPPANIPVEPLRPSGVFPVGDPNRSSGGFPPADPSRSSGGFPQHVLSPDPFSELSPGPSPFGGSVLEEQSPRLDFDDIGFELIDSQLAPGPSPTPDLGRNLPSGEPHSPQNPGLRPGLTPDARADQRRTTGGPANLAAPQPVVEPAYSYPLSAEQPEYLEPFQPEPVREQLAVHPEHRLRIPEPLVSEFDLEFHANQHDVARVLFETISSDELALDYPPQPADRTRAETSVRKAISTVNPQAHREELQDLITTELVGLGVLEKYLDDPEISEIYVNRFDRILIRRDGRLSVAPRAFSHPDFLTLAAQRLLGTRDVQVGADEVRFSDGTRVHIVMPPVSANGPILTVRKPATRHASLEDLVSQGVLSAGMAQFLVGAIEAGRSILVAGPTSSGKTTMLGALARAISPASRVIAVEETSSIKLPQESAVQLEASASYDMRFLVRQAIAMHPQRIVLDECRGPEAYDWITAAASGTEGSIMTLHGTTALDSLGRLETLAMLGNSDSNPRGLREQIARAVDLIVVLNRAPGGGFLVHKISELQGIDLDAFRLSDVYYYRVEGTDGSFHPTGYIPLFFEDLRHLGVPVDFGIFRE